MSTDRNTTTIEVRTGAGQHHVVHRVDHLEAGRLARLVGPERDRQTGVEAGSLLRRGRGDAGIRTVGVGDDIPDDDLDAFDDAGFDRREATTPHRPSWQVAR